MNNSTLDGFRQIADTQERAESYAKRFGGEAKRLYDLFYVDAKGSPNNKVGGEAWIPMTHHEAITARSKFREPASIVLVEKV